MNKEFLYKKLCYDINGCAFEAFKTVGVGYKEINYHAIFHQKLIQKGLTAKYKIPVHYDYIGKRIGDFEIDEIVENKIIVELKCIQTGFISDNYAQILNYLKLKKLSLGLLINFGLHKAFTKRVLSNCERTDNVDNWDTDFFQTIPKEMKIEQIIISIRNIDKILGPGFLCKLYKNAFTVEMNENQISCDKNICVNLQIDRIKFNPIEINYWLVDKYMLVGILAGVGNPRKYDIYRMRSYLKRLGLHHGLIAFWSPTNLRIFGVYEK